MFDGLKGFAFGLGATAGVILGLYGGFRVIEFIGYTQAKREAEREKEFARQLEEARHGGAHTAEAATTPAIPEAPAAA